MVFDLVEISQLLASIGVIAGIVFLAFEMRQNSEQLRAQSRFNYFQTRINLTKEVATNFELGRITVKKASGEELTREERYHSRFFAAAVLTGWQYEFGEYQKGNLTLDELDIQLKCHAFGLPGWSFAEALARFPASDFKKFVEERIAAPRTP
jgi:hypothetical protein